MTSGDKDKDKDRERDVVRLYLLGQLTEEERERLEEQFVTDSHFQEEVLMVEEELIEDYLGGSLSIEYKERFITHFLSTPQQRKRLEVAMALERYCGKHPDASAPTKDIPFPERAPVRPTTIAGTPFFKKAIVVYSLAAVLLVAVFVGAWSLLNRWRQPDFGQEFAILNSPQSRSSKPDLQLRLSPVVVRGESAKEVPHTRVAIVELLLALPPDEHSRYRVTLRGGSLAGQYSITNLDVTVSDAGRQVPVRIQTAHLAPGDYFLELEGLTESGASESIADYSFRVSN